MSFGQRGRLNVGGPRGAFRPSPIFMGLVALFVVTGWMVWSGIGTAGFEVFVFVACGWLISLCLHEFAHALTAYHSGDRGVAARGYLTLNPLKYTHWVFSILLPMIFLMLGGIGLPGGAVWVDHGYLRSKWHDTLVSLAGPALNVACLIAAVAPFSLGVDVYQHENFWAAVAFLAFLQLTASVLNLVPIPGVDGGNALRPWLPYEWRRGFDLISGWGMLIFLALLFNPVIGNTFFSLINSIGGALGLPQWLHDEGYALFRFWG